MANWATIKQLSDKLGIAESTLREWANHDFIVHSTIDNIMMIDQDSLNNLLNVHKNQLLSNEFIDQLLKEREREREVILSQLDNDIFMLNTQSMYQPLLQLLIQELSQFIFDDFHREFFLAITAGEPISRVANRYQLTYKQAKETYLSIFDELNKNKAKVGAYHNITMKSLVEKYKADPPLNIPLTQFFSDHIYFLLSNSIGLKTLDQLLRHTFKYGWSNLKKIKGFGATSYTEMYKALFNAGFITIGENEKIELSPEIAALLTE